MGPEKPQEDAVLSFLRGLAWCDHLVPAFLPPLSLGAELGDVLGKGGRKCVT